MIVESGKANGAILAQDGFRTQIDRAVDELLDQESKRVGFDQGGNLITELKLVEDLLHVWGEAVQESLEIGSELLLLAPGGEITQAEGGRVIEGLAGRLAKRSVLIGDAGPVEFDLSS